MGDDGAGIALIKNLRKERKSKKEREEINSNLKLIGAGTAPINYLKEISETEELVVIDTIRGGENPGTIYHLDLEDLKATTVTDSHGFSIYDVIKLAQAMTNFPVEVNIYGIEPTAINLNPVLSIPVKKAIITVKKIIEKKLKIT